MAMALHERCALIQVHHLPAASITCSGPPHLRAQLSSANLLRSHRQSGRTARPNGSRSPLLLVDVIVSRQADAHHLLAVPPHAVLAWLGADRHEALLRHFRGAEVNLLRRAGP